MTLVLHGQHFLQIPGPSPVPERVMQAMTRQIIDHRGPDFAQLGKSVLDGCRAVFKAAGPVIIYPSSGTGAWEAAIVNTLTSGDKVLMAETGHFATLWHQMASRLGIEVDFIPGDWRHGVDTGEIERRLRADSAGEIKAVMVVHNETSTGVTSDIQSVRAAIDAVGHGALLMVDAISSLGSVDYRHDEWGVDVTVSCSQKGLMLPPGLGFNALSQKAIKVGRTGGMARSYWGWDEMLQMNADGFFPYTPATNLLFGLQEAITLLVDEGLDNVFRRHRLLAQATRAAVEGWGLEILCVDEALHSPVLTAVLLPEGHDSDLVRRMSLEKYNVSLGTGLSKVAGKVFRIGHLGQCNEPTLIGAIGAVEMALADAGVPHRAGGVLAAMDVLRRK